MAHRPRKRSRTKKTRQGSVTRKKAKEILRHGEVHGRPLTKKQKGFFGARAGGAPRRKK